MMKSPHYNYYDHNHESKKNADQAIDLGRQRLNPQLSDPNYLAYYFRKQILAGWIQNIGKQQLYILDVGGRIQPYRELFESRTHSYIAIDPIYEGLVNIVALGEHLPVRSSHFDIVLCTQVLVYANNPIRFASELHRVLKPGGSLLLTTPAFFPNYHDELWRFFPLSLRKLLGSFSSIQIVPEGHSVSGFIRITCIFLDIIVKNSTLHKMLTRIVFPVLNKLGKKFDTLSDNNQMSTNYSCLAVK